MKTALKFVLKVIGILGACAALYCALDRLDRKLHAVEWLDE